MGALVDLLQRLPGRDDVFAWRAKVSTLVDGLVAAASLGKPVAMYSAKLTTDVATTSASYATLLSVVSTPANVPRHFHIALTGTVTGGGSAGSDGGAAFRLVIDGTAVPNEDFQVRFAALGDNVSPGTVNLTPTCFACVADVALSPGLHTITAEWAIFGTITTAQINASGPPYRAELAVIEQVA